MFTRVNGNGRELIGTLSRLHFSASLLCKATLISGFFGAFMKQKEDKFTRDAFEAPKVGRPLKPDAKSPAQRAREYRLRKKTAA